MWSGSEGLDGKRHTRDPGHPRLPEFGQEPFPAFLLRRGRRTGPGVSGVGGGASSGAVFSGSRSSRPRRSAVDKLRTLQAEYEAWRDGLPESLAESRTAELLEGVCDVDLDALDVDLPRGFWTRLNATAHDAHAGTMGESDPMLDTHAVARSLTAADFTPAQADALTDALRLVVEQGPKRCGNRARRPTSGGRLPMRLALVVVALVLVALLGAPASAQIQDDLGGRRAAVCAADVLDALTESQHPYTPTFHVGLATWFMGCTYFLPPSVGPILSTMRADIETIHRHRAEGEDVSGRHRTVVCRTWWAIYSSTYNGLIPEYGSGVVGDLTTPDAYWDACERWVVGVD